MKKIVSVVIVLLFLVMNSYAQENPYALETKVIQNQQQLKLLQQQQAQLYLKIDSLLVRYGEIKGEIDDIKHRLDSIQNQINQLLLRNASVPSPPSSAEKLQKTQSIVSNVNRKSVQGKPVVKQPVTPATPQVSSTSMPQKPPKPSIPEDQKAFDKALKLFKDGNYDAAIVAFKEFKDKYKSSKFIPDSIFYIAESYYNKGEYDKAIINYDYLVNTYQKSDKVPMATFKESLSFIKMGDRIDGDYLLQKVIKQYPKTKAAQLARNYLKKG